MPLYITVEGVKVLQVFFMHNDIGLYDPERDRCVEVHAFNIPEDLGQIEYVFCDKTGTLTENKMVFKRAVINGVDYWVDEGNSLVMEVYHFRVDYSPFSLLFFFPELPTEVIEGNASLEADVSLKLCFFLGFCYRALCKKIVPLCVCVYVLACTLLCQGSGPA